MPIWCTVKCVEGLPHVTENLSSHKRKPSLKNKRRHFLIQEKTFPQKYEKTFPHSRRSLPHTRRNLSSNKKKPSLKNKRKPLLTQEKAFPHTRGNLPSNMRKPLLLQEKAFPQTRRTFPPTSWNLSYNSKPFKRDTFPRTRRNLSSKIRGNSLCRWFRFAQLAKGKKFRP